MSQYPIVKSIEKRAMLEAAGESWPTCDCHDEPFYWQAQSSMELGGRWLCAVALRTYSKRQRERLIEADACVKCSGEKESWNYRVCDECKNKMSALRLDNSISKYTYLLSLDHNDPEYLKILMGGSINGS